MEERWCAAEESARLAPLLMHWRLPINAPPTHPSLPYIYTRAVGRSVCECASTHSPDICALSDVNALDESVQRKCAFAPPVCRSDAKIILRLFSAGVKQHGTMLFLILMRAFVSQGVYFCCINKMHALEVQRVWKFRKMHFHSRCAQRRSGSCCVGILFNAAQGNTILQIWHKLSRKVEWEMCRFCRRADVRSSLQGEKEQSEHTPRINCSVCLLSRSQVNEKITFAPTIIYA